MEFESSRHVAGQDSEMSGPVGRRPYVAPFLRHLAVTDTEGKSNPTPQEPNPNDKTNGPS